MSRYIDEEGRTRKKVWARAVEIALCLFIVAILAAIAIPDFFHGSARALQSEGKTNLGAIWAAQYAYFGEHNTYAGGPDCFKNLGWEPEGETKYTYWCGEDFVAPTKPDMESEHCVNVDPATTQEAFTMCAAGNVDDDDAVDTWSIRDNKNLRNDQNDVGF